MLNGLVLGDSLADNAFLFSTTNEAPDWAHLGLGKDTPC